MRIGLKKICILSALPWLICWIQWLITILMWRFIFLLNDGLGNEITESVRTICKHYQIDCIELKGLDKMSGHPRWKGWNRLVNRWRRIWIPGRIEYDGLCGDYFRGIMINSFRWYFSERYTGWSIFSH